MAKFSRFEEEMLVGAYLLADETGNDFIQLKSITDRFHIEFNPNWLHRLLQSLIDSGYSNDARHIGGDPLDQSIFLTPSGYKRGEALADHILLSPSTAGAEAPPEGSAIESVTSSAGPSVVLADSVEAELVPASDRLVPLDHNSPTLKQAIVDARQLAVDLSTSNDVGRLSPEGRQLAIEETQEIAAALEKSSVRMPAFGDRVKSTLGWIAKEAAGAVVGMAALALLALVASLFGFSI